MPRLMTILAALVALAAPVSLSAQKNDEPQRIGDVARVSRSVVRVAIIGTDPTSGAEFLLGHGSGVSVAPGVIVTNAHVVRAVMQSSNLSISIVPSEGDRRYPGNLVAADQRADLAMIRMRGGVVPVAQIFTGRPEDGMRVAAIGYPGSVDLAENLSADDQVRPLAAVRTYGQLSGGRSRRDVDTLLHTAAMARGNSGGPLVDDCGRVIGVNSFGALSEGTDAEFGFAISARELIPFLRAQQVRTRITTDPCLPAAERLAQAQRERELAERRVIEARELGLAISVALIVLGALLFAGGVVSMLYRNRWRRGLIVGNILIGVGLAMMAGSVYVFLNRPSITEITANST